MPSNQRYRQSQWTAYRTLRKKHFRGIFFLPLIFIPPVLSSDGELYWPIRNMSGGFSGKECACSVQCMLHWFNFKKIIFFIWNKTAVLIHLERLKLRKTSFSMAWGLMSFTHCRFAHDECYLRVPSLYLRSMLGMASGIASNWMLHLNTMV